ncbi:MAG: GCN5-related N-acetyltransferase [Conexibacter sp.]|jgi:L-amino acid N-acyltransferase YncA|nr:GCN5-related N-acetyltransferase [Conexibacter sp.]
MVRHADPNADAAACAAIYEPYVLGHPASFEEQPPTASQMAARIERVAATHAWLVAERDGEVAGYAYASPHRDRRAYRWSADVTVYVAAAHHREGVGRELYEALFELLRRQRLRVAVAGITLPNAGSVGLHEALGFELVGVYRRIGWKAGAWRDVGWWELQLAPEDGADDAPPEPLGPQRLDG